MKRRDTAVSGRSMPPGVRARGALHPARCSAAGHQRPPGPPESRPRGSQVVRRALWPARLAYRVWTRAVADEGAVRHNLRLLTLLTGVFSLPDLGQGLLVLTHASPGGARAYGAYVLALGVLELTGALLLARRSPHGRLVIVAAALGFYLEAALGLLGPERNVPSAVLFMVCAPAEAWVIWFLCHARVRAHLDTWSAPAPFVSALRGTMPVAQRGREGKGR